MSGWTLFFIGLASLGLVLVAFGYVGYTLYRLGRAAVYLARTYGPPTAELARKAALAERQATEAGLRAEDIVLTLERLQASLQRLQIVAEAWQHARAPWQSVRRYFGR